MLPDNVAHTYEEKLAADGVPRPALEAMMTNASYHPILGRPTNVSWEFTTEVTTPLVPGAVCYFAHDPNSPDQESKKTKKVDGKSEEEEGGKDAGGDQAELCLRLSFRLDADFRLGMLMRELLKKTSRKKKEDANDTAPGDDVEVGGEAGEANLVSEE